MPRLPHGLYLTCKQVLAAVVCKPGNDVDPDVWTIRKFHAVNLQSRYVFKQILDCQDSLLF
ncbi:hypothetical protein SM0020_03790 [Sinorhizobium meliloti CCNWSX0020]|uniref:Uncharacterized protein n=1 Tax=Sinorhizobium meliloti CCNWSX0020 TaxID=1107881 RepID=H0FUC5_RHIML|nr:hypothetical protein SM0020_03790 [Sinorhizobium meliloti CCNWSX0020]